MKITDLSPVERASLLPDGRYVCDCCDAAVDVEALVGAGGYKVCPDCDEELSGQVNMLLEASAPAEGR